MHNKVVYQVAKALQSRGIPVLRFNFRGAGLSEGSHDRGRGVTDLIGLGIPVNDSDLSYLRDCAKPKLFLQGGNDQFGSRANVEALYATLSEPKRLVIFDGGDHFFAGKLKDVGMAIDAWVAERHPETFTAACMPSD